MENNCQVEVMESRADWDGRMTAASVARRCFLGPPIVSDDIARDVGESGLERGLAMGGLALGLTPGLRGGPFSFDGA